MKEVKQYLGRAYYIEERIRSLLEQKAFTEERMLNCTNKLTHDPRASMQGDSLSAGMAKLDDLRIKLDKAIDEQVDLKAEILRRIESLQDIEHILIIELRYVQFKNWFEIERTLHYSRMSVHRKHAAALREFKKAYFDNKDDTL